MLQSQLFSKTKKDIKKDLSRGLYFLLKGDFIEEVASGVYTFLPLGYLVLKKIENLIRKEMLNLGGQEIFMPALHPKSLWEKTERWEKIDPPLFKLKDRHQKELCLAPTHEELITFHAKKRISSYKDLPLALFQIQEKFRNEMRPKGGLLRQREFLMKDLYSFHEDEKSALEFYEKVKNSYLKIFNEKLDLNAKVCQADVGTIGGRLSDEFMVELEIGEDVVFFCEKCHFFANKEVVKENFCPHCKKKLQSFRAVEVGHIFFLGDKYSKVFDLKFKDKEGKEKTVLMSCFGIGVSRLMQTIAEKKSDDKGIVWPEMISPFDFHLILLFSSKEEKEIKKEGFFLYKTLKKKGYSVLLDDRKKSFGEKLVDADIIGISKRLILSLRTLKEGKIEFKKRDEKKSKLFKIKEFLKIC